MSKYLDPTFARILDVISVLRQGLPSIDKTFRFRYDSTSSKYYQHTSNHIRLVSGAYYFAKNTRFTTHVADLLEYSIFVYQTASIERLSSRSAKQISTITPHYRLSVPPLPKSKAAVSPS